jgi:hypothetical protein
MTVSMKFGFPARKSWPPDFGGGDGGGGHELGHLEDGVGSEVVVADGAGHVVPAATCWADQA